MVLPAGCPIYFTVPSLSSSGTMCKGCHGTEQQFHREMGGKPRTIRGCHSTNKQRCHSERTGPRTLFSSGVVSEESALKIRLSPLDLDQQEPSNLYGLGWPVGPCMTAVVRFRSFQRTTEAEPKGGKRRTPRLRSQAPPGATGPSHLGTGDLSTRRVWFYRSVTTSISQFHREMSGNSQTIRGCHSWSGWEFRNKQRCHSE